MGEERPWPWEKSYPPGVSWDAPLSISTLPEMLDAFTAQWGPKRLANPCVRTAVAVAAVTTLRSCQLGGPSARRPVGSWTPGRPSPDRDRCRVEVGGRVDER